MNRNDLEKALRLIAISNRLICERGLEDCTRELVRGGATAIMLREKDLSPRGLYEVAKPLAVLCRELGVLFLVNGSVEVGLAVDADGVHLGTMSIPPEAARKIAPADFLLGFSAHNEAEIRRAESAGMNYLTLSPVFTPTSKEMSSPTLGLEGLQRLTATTELPCVALGGIAPYNAGDCIAAGACGIASIGALFGAANPRLAAEELANAIATEHTNG